MATPADETSRSHECDILREYNDRILTTFEATELIQLSHELYSKQLVDSEARDEALQSSKTHRERSSCLISALERQVKANRSLFIELMKCFLNNKNEQLVQLGVNLTEELFQRMSPFISAQATEHVQQPAVCQHSTMSEEDLSEDDSETEDTFADFKPASCLVSETDFECIKEVLTIENYKKKFSGLTKMEMIKHESILEDRSQICMLVKDGEWRSNYFLLGLDKDCIMNVTQASSQVAITAISDQEKEPIYAEIETKNFRHTKERLYVKISRTKFSYLQKCLEDPYDKLKLPVDVQFQLKYSYFHGLQMSLIHLPPHVIMKKLLPQKDNFEQVKVTEGIVRKLLLTFDQKEALKTIICSPSQGPPVLLTGPFGTGKTRLLATAAHLFFQLGSSQVRILVCTQQHVSADAFLEFFLREPSGEFEALVVKRLMPERFSRYTNKKFCTTIHQLKESRLLSTSRNILIIGTCMTINVLFKAFPREQDYYFTHIFLDEGAQPREPEGVIPLRYAAEDTKIVVAGDQHQVGPAVLVLGEEARENGLGVSLLERLMQHYQECGPVAKSYCPVLYTNNRCHSKIMDLSNRLFYDTHMQCSVPEDSAHPNASFPLLFVCSSLSKSCHVRDPENEKEISIILGQIKQYTDSWPVDKWGEKDLSQVCILSPHRSQVSEILKSLRLHQELHDVSLQPTYNIQGCEYRAVFLSTSEPTDKSGYSLNPTKSLTDPYVFNTAITRAQSLVVAVGNPFLLLAMEQHMVERYGKKGKCWSTYLKYCLENNTISCNSLGLSEEEQRGLLYELRSEVDKIVGPQSPPS